MRFLAILVFSLFLNQILLAQTKNVFTLKADSVKITNCDSSELIIENHTQNVPGFLYNTGNGRTIFKRAAFKLNDSMYVFGGDTLKLSSTGGSANAWVQGGNSWHTAGFFGTLDSNDINFYTNNKHRANLSATTGVFSTDSDALIHYLSVGSGPNVYNTRYGRQALAGTPAGNGSIGIGYQAGISATGHSVIIGYQAGVTSRGESILIGDAAGSNEYTHGLVAIGQNTATYAQGGYNIAIGYASMDSVNGYFNTVLGHGSAVKLKAAADNTIIGTETGNYLTTGSYNILVGSQTGDSLTTGSYNTIIGTNLNAISPALSYSIMLADGAGNKRIFADKFGNVAVGTTSPNSLFQVSRTDSIGGPGFATGSTGTYQVIGQLGTEFTNTFKRGDSITIASSYNGIPGIAETRIVDSVVNDSLLLVTAPFSAYRIGVYKATKKDILKVKGYGYVGLSIDMPTSKLDINGDNGYNQLRLRNSYTPTSSSDPNGNVGDFSWDSNYLYIKTPGGWKRSAFTNF